MNNGLYSQPVQPQEVSTLVSENVQKGHRKQIETFLLNLHFNFQEWSLDEIWLSVITETSDTWSQLSQISARQDNHKHHQHDVWAWNICTKPKCFLDYNKHSASLNEQRQFIATTSTIIYINEQNRLIKIEQNNITYQIYFLLITIIAKSIFFSINRIYQMLLKQLELTEMGPTTTS